MQFVGQSQEGGEKCTVSPGLASRYLFKWGCRDWIVTHLVLLNSTAEPLLLTLLNEAISLLWRLSAAWPMLGRFLP